MYQVSSDTQVGERGGLDNLNLLLRCVLFLDCDSGRLTSIDTAILDVIRGATLPLHHYAHQRVNVGTCQ